MVAKMLATIVINYRRSVVSKTIHAGTYKSLYKIKSRIEIAQQHHQSKALATPMKDVPFIIVVNLSGTKVIPHLYTGIPESPQYLYLCS